MLKISWPARLCLLLIALGGSACSNSYGEVCTLIGCESGLSVELVGDVPEEYTISVEPADGGPSRTVECGPESACGAAVFFADFTPDSVRVTVEADGTTTSEPFKPSYELVRPNGPDCPPECRQATVVVEL